MKKLSPTAQAVLIKLGAQVICDNPQYMGCRRCPHSVSHDRTKFCPGHVGIDCVHGCVVSATAGCNLNIKEVE